MNCPRRHMWLAVSGFMVMGLISGLSLANHPDSGSFLVVHALFSQDGCQWEGFPEVVGQVVSPLHLSQTLPVGGGLSVLCSLKDLLSLNNSCKWLLWCLARAGVFNQCASPNVTTLYSVCFFILGRRFPVKMEINRFLCPFYFRGGDLIFFFSIRFSTAISNLVNFWPESSF